MTMRFSGLATLVVACGFCAAMAAGCGGGGDATDNGGNGDVMSDNGAIDSGDTASPDADDHRDVTDPQDHPNGDSIGDPDLKDPDALPDAPDADQPDAPDTDTPDVPGDEVCFPSCKSVECGMDPICGLQDCGTCGDGTECLAGECESLGCWYAAGYVCLDSFTAPEGTQVDWAAYQEMCEGDGGAWQVCPSDDAVLIVRVENSNGGSFESHNYYPMYCNPVDALAAARDEYPESTLTTVWADSEATCGTDTTPSVACMFSNQLVPVCTEMAGGVPVEKATAWSAWCRDGRGGTVLETCPPAEEFACESGPAYVGAWYTVKHYYGPDSFGTAADACAALEGSWLTATCTEDNEQWGTCDIVVRRCAHPAGGWDPAYWQAVITYEAAQAQGSGLSLVDAADAFDAAFANLELVTDMSGCPQP